MNILFDHERLLQLINSLYTLTGIRANIFGVDAKQICLSDDHAPFCELINASPEGHRRCVACDTQAVLRQSEDTGCCFYRCHAGICEALMPIGEGGRPLAYLSFGQMLDDTDLDAQWKNTAATLGWYPGDLEQLRQAFLAFRQYTRKELDAYVEVLGALIAYIQLKGIIQTSEQTDLQKLEHYLDQHYTEKLSLESIAADLNIGRTKLCALAKKLSGGSTLSRMIAERRIEAAKTLLLQGDEPISAVAEAVGVSDYNYFTKIFRTATGMTPSAFRRENRKRMEEHSLS